MGLDELGRCAAAGISGNPRSADRRPSRPIFNTAATAWSPISPALDAVGVLSRSRTQSQERTKTPGGELMRFRIGVHPETSLLMRKPVVTVSTSLLGCRRWPARRDLSFWWCAIKSEPDCRWRWSPWASSGQEHCRAGSRLWDWWNARPGWRRPPGPARLSEPACLPRLWY